MSIFQGVTYGIFFLDNKNMKSYKASCGKSGSGNERLGGYNVAFTAVAMEF